MHRHRARRAWTPEEDILLTSVWQSEGDNVKALELLGGRSMQSIIKRRHYLAHIAQHKEWRQAWMSGPQKTAWTVDDTDRLRKMYVEGRNQDQLLKAFLERSRNSIQMKLLRIRRQYGLPLQSLPGRWSSAEEAQLRDARAQGISFRECASILGRTYPSVHNDWHYYLKEAKNDDARRVMPS